MAAAAWSELPRGQVPDRLRRAGARVDHQDRVELRDAVAAAEEVRVRADRAPPRRRAAPSGSARRAASRRASPSRSRREDTSAGVSPPSEHGAAGRTALRPHPGAASRASPAATGTRRRIGAIGANARHRRRRRVAGRRLSRAAVCAPPQPATQREHGQERAPRRIAADAASPLTSALTALMLGVAARLASSARCAASPSCRRTRARPRASAWTTLGGGVRQHRRPVGDRHAGRHRARLVGLADGGTISVSRNGGAAEDGRHRRSRAPGGRSSSSSRTARSSSTSRTRPASAGMTSTDDGQTGPARSRRSRTRPGPSRARRSRPTARRTSPRTAPASSTSSAA